MTPQAFAKLLRRTQDIREASWVEDKLHPHASRYTKIYDEAAEEATTELLVAKDWAQIVAIVLFQGYADVWDWCDSVHPIKAPNTEMDFRE